MPSSSKTINMKYTKLLCLTLLFLASSLKAQITETDNHILDIDLSCLWKPGKFKHAADIAYSIKLKDNKSFIGGEFGYRSNGSIERRLLLGPSYTYNFNSMTKGLFINNSIHLEQVKISGGTYYNPRNYAEVSPVSTYMGASIKSSIGYQFRKANKNRGFKIQYGIEGRFYKDFLLDFVNSFSRDYKGVSDYKFKFEHWLMFGYSFFF